MNKKSTPKTVQGQVFESEPKTYTFFAPVVELKPKHPNIVRVRLGPGVSPTILTGAGKATRHRRGGLWSKGKS